MTASDPGRAGEDGGQDQRSTRRVDLISIYPTLCELTGIETTDHVEGTSTVPLLKDSAAEWELPVITTHGRGHHAVRTGDHRYIRYADGSEEFYDDTADPYEWSSLAKNPEYAALKKRLAQRLPKEEVQEAKK